MAAAWQERLAAPLEPLRLIDAMSWERCKRDQSFIAFPSY
jgi:hypothetical protein